MFYPNPTEITWARLLLPWGGDRERSQLEAEVGLRDTGVDNTSSPKRSLSPCITPFLQELPGAWLPKPLVCVTLTTFPHWCVPHQPLPRKSINNTQIMQCYGGESAFSSSSWRENCAGSNERRGVGNCATVNSAGINLCC